MSEIPLPPDDRRYEPPKIKEPKERSLKRLILGIIFLITGVFLLIFTIPTFSVFPSPVVNWGGAFLFLFLGIILLVVGLVLVATLGW